MPDKYKLEGEHCIKLKDADNPTNINWENLGQSSSKRRFRKLIFYLTIFLAMTITIVLVIFGSYFSKIAAD